MSKEFDRFVRIIATLRGPDGCPWDKEQTHSSLLPCLLDETYEFFEAADENVPEKMKEELGDLLLQIGLHAQMANERDEYDIEEVIHDINEKLIRRHPHVFGDVKADTASDVIVNWEAIKSREKGKRERESLLDGIPPNLPALYRAQKVQRRAGRVGFDWSEIEPVLDKVEEEFAEFREALTAGDHDHAEEELGDILFALVNVARHKKISAEDALRRTIGKFMKRFRYIEKRFKAEGKKLQEATLEEMDALWEESKEK